MGISILERTGDLNLVEGLMLKYGETGNAIVALRWALPQVLNQLNAEAGSLFVHREEDNMLECVVCAGPVDVSGIAVPANKGLVGRAFTSRRAEIVSDASHDAAHYRKADTDSGFKTVSTATAPVQLGAKCFGSIQAINRRSPTNANDIINFTEADLALLSSLATALAMAISNVRLAERAISHQLVQRDLDQAIEAQAQLIPDLDPDGFVAGKMLPACQLSGDFYDYRHIGSRIAFCQGDVTGKGITAALMMARTIALFGNMIKHESDPVRIACAINAELCAVASDRFVTFVTGWLNPHDGTAELINCGHGPIILMEEDRGEASVIDSHTMPLGLTDFHASRLNAWQGDLRGASLYIATDGITESQGVDGEWGVAGLMEEAKTHRGMTSAARLSAIMRKFIKGELTTHDDATLLVVSTVGRQIWDTVG